METASQRKLIGLHITKCAGTTLASALRRRLEEDSYYFCSSYYENILASRPSFAELTEIERLRICFGHYVNEYFLPVIGADAFLFTGLRDPVRRAVSHFGQENWIRFSAGNEPISAQEYIKSAPGTICVELRRAFPTIAEQGPKDEWKQALQILSLFNYAYMTEGFEDHAQTVLDLLGAPDAKLVSDNVTEARDYPSDLKAYLGSEAKALAGIAGDFCYDDIMVFEKLRALCGEVDALPALKPVKLLQTSEFFVPRSDLLNTLPEPRVCIQRIASLEARYMVHEFLILNRMEMLKERLSARIQNAEQILELVAEREMWT